MLEFLIACAVVAAVVLWQRRRAGIGAGAVRPKVRKKPCRWEKTGGGSPAFTEFRCKRCGVIAYGRNGQSPAMCKSGLDRGGL